MICKRIMYIHCMHEKWFILFFLNLVLGSHQPVRCGHTDVKPPDMSKYRRWSELNKSANEDTSYGRRIFSHSVLALGGMAFLTGAKCVGVSLIDMKNPSAAAWAVSKTEVNIGKIPEGLLPSSGCYSAIIQYNRDKSRGFI